MSRWIVSFVSATTRLGEPVALALMAKSAQVMATRVIRNFMFPPGSVYQPILTRLGGEFTNQARELGGLIQRHERPRVVDQLESAVGDRSRELSPVVDLEE